MTRKSLILHSIIPLFIGFLYYALFRENSYIFTVIHRIVNLPSSSVSVPRIINNHFCDCLWGYSLYMMLYLVTNNHIRSLLFSIPFIILLEVLQVKMSNMTFDVFDIISEFVSLVVAIIVIHISSERGEKNEKKKNNN